MEYVENILRYGKKMMSSSWSTDVLNFLLDGIKNDCLFNDLCRYYAISKCLPKLRPLSLLHTIKTYSYILQIPIKLKPWNWKYFLILLRIHPFHSFLKSSRYFTSIYPPRFLGKYSLFLLLFHAFLKSFGYFTSNIYGVRYTSPLLVPTLHLFPHLESWSLPSGTNSDTSLYNQSIQESEKWRKHSFIKHNELSLLNLSYRKEETI